MDEIADDSAAKVKECQGTAPGLGQEQMSPRRRRETFSLPGLCSLPGSLADPFWINPFWITQPVLKISDCYYDTLPIV